MGIEVGILLILAGYALLKSKDKPQKELEENPYIDSSELEQKQDSMNPFPVLEQGNPFNDNFTGFAQESGSYVDSPNANDFMSDSGFMSYSNIAPATSLKPLSLGTEQMGTSPGFVDYENAAPYASPQAEVRQSITYNTQDYVPSIEEVAPRAPTVATQTQLITPSTPIYTPTVQPVVQKPGLPTLTRQSDNFSLLTGMGYLPYRR